MLTQFFHSNLAFFDLSLNEMIEIYDVCCYTCDNTIFDANINFKVAILRSVLSLSQLVNSVYHDKGGVLYGAVNGKGYKRAWNDVSCRLTIGRLAFHHLALHLFECESGEIIALLLATSSKNVTISELKAFGAANKPQDGWRWSFRASSFYFGRQPYDILFYCWKIAFGFYRDLFSIL